MQAATARQVQHEKQLQGEPSKLTASLPIGCCSWSVLPCKPRATRRERACANKHECLLQEVFRKPICNSKLLIMYALSFWISVIRTRQSDAAMAARRTTASRLFEVKIAACSNDRAAQDARRADPALQRQPCARPKLTASLDAVLGSCSLHTSGSEQLPTNTGNIYVV